MDGSSQSKVFENTMKIRHRGPDCIGTWEASLDSPSNESSTVLAHTRLSIMNPGSGTQPIVNQATNLVLSVNGEIYNYKSLSDLFFIQPSKLKSDCDVITHLFEPSFNDHDIIRRRLNVLEGMFAFVLTNRREPWKWMIARDPIGIIPLYIGLDKSRPHSLFVASEMKALGNCDFVTEFEPGTYLTHNDDMPHIYYGPLQCKSIPIQKNMLASNELHSSKSTHLLAYGADVDADYILDPYEYGMFTNILKIKFMTAVRTHLQCDIITKNSPMGVPVVGVLLSGGLDSSIIAACVRDIIGDKGDIHTFSIGLEHSPDIFHARAMAKHINSIHHEFIFTVQEALEALPDVVYYIETYDTTTIRASTPMFLMARKIKELGLGLKVVLSGEGADEIFAGYLYFKKAPNPDELQKELERKVSLLSYFDCQRANKSMMSAGIELRVPFLDTNFLNYAMRIPPIMKMCKLGLEKKILRDAFKTLLPESVYTRQKEQFSDGIGYSWIDGIQQFVENKYPSVDYGHYPINTPTTKEQYYYRELFEKVFPGDDRAVTVYWDANTVACSTGKALEWDEELRYRIDPSGRMLSHHNYASG
jgi:asparagine synthase (glutamine-hydrolysing)